MSRFRIRREYDADELAPGERVQQGIAGAISQHLSEQQDRKQFENQARQADPGATFDEEPSAWAKLMGHFGRTPSMQRPGPTAAPPPVPAAQRPQFGMDQAGHATARPGLAAPAPAPRTMIQGPGRERAYVDPYARARAESSIRLDEKSSELALEQPYKLQQLHATHDPAEERQLAALLLHNAQSERAENGRERRHQETLAANAPTREMVNADRSERIAASQDRRRGAGARRLVERLAAQNPGRPITAEAMTTYLDALRRNRPEELGDVGHEDALAALQEFNDKGLPATNRRRPTTPAQKRPITQGEFDTLLGQGYTREEIARTRDVSQVGSRTRRKP